MVIEERLNKLIFEYSERLNGNKFPDGILPGSHKKFWWECSLGHEWETQFYSRTLLGSDCPYCSNKKTLAGFNDITSLRPDLLDFWDYELNQISPNTIGPNSRTQVHWIFKECNHKLFTICSSFSKRKSYSCKECSVKKTENGDSLTNENHVSSPVVHTVAQDFEKFTEQVQGIQNKLYVSSKQKVVLICENEHPREKQVRAFFRKDKEGKHQFVECELCNFDTTKLLMNQDWFSLDIWGDNDFPLDRITFGSGRLFWWKGICGHQWRKRISEYLMHKECPICTNKEILIGFNDLKTVNPKLASEWHPDNEMSPSEVAFFSSSKVLWKGECGHEWEAKPGDRHTRNSGCFKCAYRSRTSKGEKELADLLRECGFDIIENDRQLIHPSELDIFIPSKNIAIEFNGLYWHTEAKGKGKYYHYNKWDACRKAGVQLIQIWEDDWVQNKDLVVSMVMNKLGANNSESVFARKASVTQLSHQECSDFLDKYHIQGSTKGSVRLALEIDNLIVAVMIFSRSGAVLSLLRYATACNVPGGFSKLLSYAIKQNEDIEKIVTFSNNEISDGRLYLANGFSADAHLPPDYSYVDFSGSRIREHKFLYRLKRFKNDPNLKWVDNKTEKELALLNNLERIWDSGKVRWIKTLT